MMTTLLRAVLFVVLLSPPASAQWVAPIGIPAPPAGLAPDRATPTAASQCPSWPTAVSANCYYVNNTGSCSDATDGTPSQPRCTLPGSVSYRRIEIVGGGADYAITPRRWTAVGGSESNPSVITGIRGACLNPVLSEAFPSGSEASWQACPVLAAAPTEGVLISVPGTWVIVEGLNLRATQFYAGGQHLDNAIFRWNHTYGIRDNNSVAYALAYGVNSANYNNNIVIYNTEVSDWCDMASTGEEDCIGTAANRGSSNWWVVDNLWYDINGDSIRTGTNPAGGAHLYDAADPFACPLHDTNRGFNHYVGRNTFKLNGENAIDVKDSVHAVFSQNTITGPFNLGGSGTGGGGAISSHNHARDTWILYNLIQTTEIGIAITTDIAGTENGYYIGNVIVDTKATGTFNASSSGQNDGAAVHIRTARGACIFQHNTIYSVQRGFNIETGQADCQLMDNIVSTLTTNHGAFGWEDSGALIGTARFSHNLVHYGTGRFGNIGSSFYTTLAAFNAASSLDCTSCLESNPLLTNPAGGLFTLGSSSPARDAGSGVTTYYDLFQSLYGLDIRKDRAGGARPNGAWDIGAYEFGASAGVPTPASPSGVRIIR